MKEINVMVTSVGGIVGQGIIKSLKYHNNYTKKKKYKYSILGTDLSYDACGLYRINKFSIISKPTSKNYIKSLIDLCNKNDIDIVLPGSDVELPVISENQEILENKTKAKIVTNQKNIVDLCRDKYSTFQFLRENKLNYIPTCLPEEVDSFLKDYRFPLVAKPREGFGSKLIYIAGNLEELSFAVKTIKHYGWKPIIQKYLKNDNEEYTTGITVDKEGKLIMSSITMKKILKHGQTYKAFIDKYPKIKNICKIIVNKLGAVGPINIQSRIDDDDKKVKVIEINPRFSASTPMRAVAGVNEPDLLIRNLLFNEKIKILQYRSLVCLRYWNETYLDLTQFQRIKTGKTAIKNVKSETFEYF